MLTRSLLAPALPTSLRGILRLLRPLNFVMFGLGVALGGVLVRGQAAFTGDYGDPLLLAMLSAALIGGGANAINDVFDLDIDRVNRPARPLPAGKVSVGVARGLWGVTSAVGVLLSFWLTAAHVVLAVVSVMLLYGYSAYFKRTVFAGNLLVALIVALALVYGGWAVGPPEPALVGAAFAFLTTLARELIKDAEDVQGDARAGAQTLPVRYGVPVTLRIATALIFLTLLLTPLPFLLLGYSPLFLLLVLGTDVLLLHVLRSLAAEADRTRLGRASTWLKWAMLAGILALALSGSSG